jgi:hypothetical protein
MNASGAASAVPRRPTKSVRGIQVGLAEAKLLLHHVPPVAVWRTIA